MDLRINLSIPSVSNLGFHYNYYSNARHRRESRESGGGVKRPKKGGVQIDLPLFYSKSITLYSITLR